MLKKIALLALLFILPLGVFAQNVKFGHLKSGEILKMMPEYAKAETDMQALQKKYSDEIQASQAELQKKYTEYMQQADSLPKNLAERKQKDINELAQRAEQFQQEVPNILAKAQEDMLTPIFKKMEDAIVAVGTEGGYIYVFDLSRTAIPFVNEKQSTDVTSQVKAKLGIK